MDIFRLSFSELMGDFQGGRSMFSMTKMITNAVFFWVLFGFLAGPVYADWQVTLQAEIPDSAADSGMAASKLIFGMGVETTDAFDNQWDTVALASNSLNFHSLHPEYSTEKAKLWKDVRSTAFPKDWEVEVSSPLVGQIRLTWNAGVVPADIDLQLIDEQTATSLDMKASGQYSFTNSPPGVRKFMIHAAEKTSSGGTPVAPPPQTSPPVSSGSGGGGGCGTLKDAGRDNQSPLHQGTAALNVAILFTPLIWLIIRKVVFAEALIYSETSQRRRYPIRYHEDPFPWRSGSRSIRSYNFIIDRLWGRGRDSRRRER